MDFDLTPRCEELLERIRAFQAEHVYPVEMEALRALDDEVRPGVPYPESSSRSASGPRRMAFGTSSSPMRSTEAA